MAILLLAGCAANPATQPQVVSTVRTEEVRIPVLMPCLTADEIPKPPGTWMDETMTKDKRRLALLADLKELDEYILKSQTLMRGCVKDGK